MAPAGAEALLRSLILEDTALARLLGQHQGDSIAAHFARMVERNNVQLLSLLPESASGAADHRRPSSPAEPEFPPQCAALPGGNWVLVAKPDVDVSALNRDFLTRQHLKQECYVAILESDAGQWEPHPALVAELTGMVTRHRALADLVDRRD